MLHTAKYRLTPVTPAVVSITQAEADERAARKDFSRFLADSRLSASVKAQYLEDFLARIDNAKHTHPAPPIHIIDEEASKPPPQSFKSPARYYTPKESPVKKRIFYSRNLKNSPLYDSPRTPRPAAAAAAAAAPAASPLVSNTPLPPTPKGSDSPNWREGMKTSEELRTPHVPTPKTDSPVTVRRSTRTRKVPLRYQGGAGRKLYVKSWKE